MKKLLMLIILLTSLTACTEKQRFREFGGKMTIRVPAGKKVITATWKQYSLFYMLEPMEPEYTPKTKTFIEDVGSSISKTEVVFIESK